MKRLFMLTAALVATAAHPQTSQTSIGHIAYTGSSVDFEDAGENSTLVSSRRYIYEFNGFGASWTRIFRPPVSPEGLGVTTLPDGRRCIFWIESEELFNTCELNARQGNWAAIGFWKQPQLGTMSFFQFTRIAVLGPANATGAANGQIPMVFAVGRNSNLVMLRQYRNGSWGNWQRVASLYRPAAIPNPRPSDISAAWDSGCANVPGRVIVNVVAESQYHRFWVEAGTAENSAPRDFSHATPPVGESTVRMAPLPGWCASEVNDFGHSVYVTSSGALYWTRSDNLSHLATAPLAVPAPVQAIHARGQMWSYRLYMEDINGNAWIATIVAGQVPPADPVVWTLAE